MSSSLNKQSLAQLTSQPPSQIKSNRSPFSGKLQSVGARLKLSILLTVACLFAALLFAALLFAALLFDIVI